MLIYDIYSSPTAIGMLNVSKIKFKIVQLDIRLTTYLCIAQPKYVEYESELKLVVRIVSHIIALLK